MIKLEALHQCFVHPDARIRLEHEESGAAQIVSLKVVNKGFLQGHSFALDEVVERVLGQVGVQQND